jgi:hypothetical protein
MKGVFVPLDMRVVLEVGLHMEHMFRIQMVEQGFEVYFSLIYLGVQTD